MNLVTSRKYTLIAKELEKIIKITDNIDADANRYEEMFDKTMELGVRMINDIFEGETIMKKRRENNKVYYAFSMDDTLIFECGFEEDGE